MNLRLILFSALVLAACDLSADHRVIANGPLDVGRQVVVIQPTPPLRAIGPNDELCLELPEAYQLGQSTVPADQWKIGRPDGALVTVRAVLVAPDGRRDSLPGPGFEFGAVQKACFITHPARDLGRRYVRLELSADDSIHVRSVSWYAGERYAVP